MRYFSGEGRGGVEVTKLPGPPADRNPARPVLCPARLRREVAAAERCGVCGGTSARSENEGRRRERMGVRTPGNIPNLSFYPANYRRIKF